MKVFSSALLALALLLALAVPARAQYSELEENPVVPAVSEFYGVETVQTVTIMQNVSDPDDLLVTLFLARASGTDPVRINEMRKKAKSWNDLFSHLGVHPGALFQALEGVQVPESCPDYAWAQRKYREWKANPKAGLPLYDKTVRLLVGLDFMVRRFDLTPVEVMKARKGAKSTMALLERRLDARR